MKSHKIYNDIVETTGNTPLVKLNRITKGLKSEIYAKIEFFNPAGSVKDRIAKYMIETAEKKGKIKPGDTIVENSSGNTALALAIVCSVRGYNLKIVIRDSTSPDKLKILKALNVDLILVDSTLPPESPDSYNNLAPRIAAKTPNSYYLDQHNDRTNNEAHYKTTGPEIWEQMQGQIDYFVAGVGTGGTICGVAQFLKEKDPDIQVIGVDPKGSVFYDYFHKGKKIKPSPYLIEGLGDEFLIGCVDFSLLDDIYQITDQTAFEMTRKIAEKEAIMAGGSSGAALWGALKLAHEIDRPARIVTLFPDSANRYISSIFNDSWLKEKGLME
ncbi:MAG: pyridoxal-phosphate dependent enzyme [Candidatus Aminicenantes bacterium]|nr:pyridoxal-phosphate dependent enzyme [Candidatus Aminicenantes bacterium]